VKQAVAFVILFLACGLSAFKPDNGKHYSIKTIVIDPGHGGHDSGCLGASSKEKDVALAISLKLGKLIEEQFKDVRVIYTRKTDVFIELHERAEIANNNKADLFICIHCNSGPKDAFGTETYVMGLHRSENNLSVAKRENAAILMENDYKAKYDGFDPNSPEANIIFTLYQNAFLDQSLALSSQIQKQFKDKLGRSSRGVKQAGFLVLYKTTMPSILIETGFLTHPTEEKYLASEEGQTNISEAIFKAFKLYKKDLEYNGTSNEKEEPETPKKEVKNEATRQETLSDLNKPDANNKEKKVLTVSLETEHKKTVVENAIGPASVDSAVLALKKPDDVANVIFKIQLAAAAAEEVLHSKEVKAMDNISSVKSNKGLYAIYFGETRDFKEVVNMQSIARKKGFKEAFAVAFNNGKRITIAEALSLLKKK
jgi:N-acetylmuramoyl-L-alanine amidase